MKRILIVEDEPRILELLKVRLESSGFQVFTAEQGEEGYRKYKKIHPDLMILDLNLPKLNGTEVCRRIRRQDEDTKTPIIMLTAKSEDADKIIGKVIGADLYMTKPFEAKELLENINKLLVLKTSYKEE